MCELLLHPLATLQTYCNITLRDYTDRWIAFLVDFGDLRQITLVICFVHSHILCLLRVHGVHGCLTLSLCAYDCSSIYGP